MLHCFLPTPPAEHYVQQPPPLVNEFPPFLSVLGLLMDVALEAFPHKHWTNVTSRVMRNDTYTRASTCLTWICCMGHSSRFFYFYFLSRWTLVLAPVCTDLSLKYVGSLVAPKVWYLGRSWMLAGFNKSFSLLSLLLAHWTQCAAKVCLFGSCVLFSELLIIAVKNVLIGVITMLHQHKQMI